MKSAIVIALALVCLGLLSTVSEAFRGQQRGSFGAIRTDGVSQTLKTIIQILDQSPLLAKPKDLTRRYSGNYSEIVSDLPAAVDAYSTVQTMREPLFNLSSANLDALLPTLVHDAAKVDNATMVYQTRILANILQETEVHNTLIHTKNKLEEFMKMMNCSSSDNGTCEALAEAVAILMPAIGLWEKQIAPVLIQQRSDIVLFTTNFLVVRTNLGLIQQAPSTFPYLIGLVLSKYDEACPFLLNFISSNF